MAWPGLLKPWLGLAGFWLWARAGKTLRFNACLLRHSLLRFTQNVSSNLEADKAPTRVSGLSEVETRPATLVEFGPGSGRVGLNFQKPGLGSGLGSSTRPEQHYFHFEFGKAGDDVGSLSLFHYPIAWLSEAKKIHSRGARASGARPSSGNSAKEPHPDGLEVRVKDIVLRANVALVCRPERPRFGGPPERSEGGEGTGMVGPLRANQERRLQQVLSRHDSLTSSGLDCLPGAASGIKPALSEACLRTNAPNSRDQGWEVAET
ncbi:hypothetical protein R3P38DRAFT_2810477 [Favolaschia claudopus]|uniref:Uncharacterized protein n=1 Tax=Favolaschia claudopus TaxID=2862362 RepID=A0AAV9ZBS9_9AGAR